MSEARKPLNRSRREWLRIAALSPLLARRALPQSSRSSLKITGFTIHKVTVRWRDLVFLEVHTDAGITGLGEATLEGRAEQAEAALRWLEPGMIGRDPSAIEDHWNRNYYLQSRWRNGPDTLTAIAAVDIALWDIQGKRLGLSVAELLGGPIRKSFRVYYTHWAAPIESGTRDLERFRNRARQTKAEGWTALKWTMPAAGSDTERIRQTVAEVRAVREAVGPEVDIALEAAETLTARSTLALARELAPCKPLWIEEPTIRESAKVLGEVAGKSPVPIASGEGLFTRYEFLDLFEKRGAAIAQPDVLHAGGITELRKIASMAEPFGVEIAPHQCSGPIGHIASLFAMSTCRNFLIQEWEAADDALFSEMTGGHYPVQNAWLCHAPLGPGARHSD